MDNDATQETTQQIQDAFESGEPSDIGGRVNAERATLGVDDYAAGDVAAGESVDNVGSPEGDLPDEATAEFPGIDPRQQPGITDREPSERP